MCVCVDQRGKISEAHSLRSEEIRRCCCRVRLVAGYWCLGNTSWYVGESKACATTAATKCENLFDQVCVTMWCGTVSRPRMSTVAKAAFAYCESLDAGMIACRAATGRALARPNGAEVSARVSQRKPTSAQLPHRPLCRWMRRRNNCRVGDVPENANRIRSTVGVNRRGGCDQSGTMSATMKRLPQPNFERNTKAYHHTDLSFRNFSASALAMRPPTARDADANRPSIALPQCVHPIRRAVAALQRRRGGKGGRSPAIAGHADRNGTPGRAFQQPRNGLPRCCIARDGRLPCWLAGPDGAHPLGAHHQPPLWVHGQDRIPQEGGSRFPAAIGLSTSDPRIPAVGSSAAGILASRGCWPRR